MWMTLPTWLGVGPIFADRFLFSKTLEKKSFPKTFPSFLKNLFKRSILRQKKDAHPLAKANGWLCLWTIKPSRTRLSGEQSFGKFLLKDQGTNILITKKEDKDRQGFGALLWCDKSLSEIVYFQGNSYWCCVFYPSCVRRHCPNNLVEEIASKIAAVLREPVYMAKGYGSITFNWSDWIRSKAGCRRIHQCSLQQNRWQGFSNLQVRYYTVYSASCCAWGINVTCMAFGPRFARVQH